MDRATTTAIAGSGGRWKVVTEAMAGWIGGKAERGAAMAAAMVDKREVEGCHNGWIGSKAGRAIAMAMAMAMVRSAGRKEVDGGNCCSAR